MYIPVQSIVLTVIIILLTWAIWKSYKRDMEHNKSKLEPPSENKEPEPKCENTTYTFFKEEAYKAFEVYKAAGEKVSWEPENDGFSLKIESPDIMEDEMFSVSVECDNNNRLNLTAPYYLCITYSFSIRKDRSGYCHNLANFLNNYYRTHNMLSKELFCVHGVFTVEYSNIGRYTSCIFLTDIFYLWRQTKAFGEKGAFDRFFIMAKEKYTEGRKLHKDSIEQALKDLK
nr:MAG TPA: hypothetical protein [Caudoviricetes sp.]